MLARRIPSPIQRWPWPLLVLLLLGVIIAGIAWFAYRAESAALERHALNSLQTVADLKVDAIARSLAGQRSRTTILGHAPTFIAFLRRGVDRTSPADRLHILGFMEEIRASADLDNVLLMDEAGRPVATARGDRSDEAVWSAAAKRAVATGETVFVDFHRDVRDGGVDLGFAAPILAAGDAGRGVLGVVALDITASSFLDPGLTVWPTASPTGQAMLVRKKGGDILYLGEFSGGRNAPLELRRLPAAADAITARRLRGETVPTVWRDLRGVQVLAASAALPGTPWMLLVKMDRREALAEVRRLGFSTGMLTLAALIASIIFVFFLEQRRRLHAALAEMAHDRALQAAETQFRGVFEQAAVGIALLAPNGRWLQFNRRLCDMLGYAERELFAQTVLEITHPDDRAAAQALTHRMESGEIDRYATERRYLRRDGDTVWAASSVQLVRKADGAPDYYISVMEDIGERKRHEEALRKSEEQLRQSQKMEAIGNLTGGMAHDFNNLLGVIIGNLDLAGPMVAKNGDAGELIGEATEAALRGADLTRRLLAFARRQPLRPQRVAINDLVAGMVKLLSRTLGENIQISSDLAPTLWPVVADPVQIEAALANLATNARDAMPSGGWLRITTGNRQLDADYVALHPDVRPGDYAMIEVSDTGTGMTPDVVAHIFEPFFTTKELGKGTGLGLSMVFGFMKQSGGHISVYSEPGTGTAFRLYLPRAAEDTGEIAEPKILEPRRAAGETVLAVEDNDALRRLVARQLADLGYRVIAARNATDALAELEREAVNLLMTDIVMPGEMDGFALARQVLSRWPSVKVVLTSGFPEIRINGKLGALAGSARMLSKPYRRQDLAQVLRDALGG